MATSVEDLIAQRDDHVLGARGTLFSADERAAIIREYDTIIAAAKA